VRYLTHQFTSTETLDRARRWLLDAGVSPERMLAHHHGIPSITVAVETGEADGVEMVVRAAAMEDPSGLPGFWDLARLNPVHEDVIEPAESPPSASAPSTFVLHWEPVEPSLVDEGESLEVSLQRAYQQRRA
jgi:hypothetical protein